MERDRPRWCRVVVLLVEGRGIAGLSGSVRLALQAGLSSVFSTCEAMDSMQRHECVAIVVDVTQSCTRAHELQRK